MYCVQGSGGILGSDPSTDITVNLRFLRLFGSDHRLVAATVKLSLTSNKSQPRKIKYDWDTLRWNRELQEKYTVAVKNRFMILSDSVQHETATDKYGRFTKAISDTTEELVPKVTRSNRLDPSQDSRVIQSRETVTEAYKSYHQTPDVNNRQNVKIAKEQLNQTYMVVHEELLAKKVEAVEAAAIQAKHRQSWVLINDICGKCKAGCGLIKGDSNENKVKVWENHFRNLLGEVLLIDEHSIPERETDLNISTEPFSRVELFQAKKIIS